MSPFQGWTTRTITLLIAGLFGFPFLLKIWNGEPFSTGELVALSFGMIAVCVFLRYAHLLGRTFWTIRHGEIRIERIQLNGKPHVDTVVGRDIARIAVVQHSAEEVWFTITIWLQSGRRLTSPQIHDQAQARALEAEITRRLGVAQDRQLQPTS